MSERAIHRTETPQTDVAERRLDLNPSRDAPRT